MPKGVEHGGDADHGEHHAELFVPLMPKGVEHTIGVDQLDITDLCLFR